MRGTMKITNSTNLHYLQRNYLNLDKVSQQVAAQRQVLHLEDDPLSATVGIRMLNIMSRTKQYMKNIDTGTAFLDLTDQSLGSVHSQIKKVYDLLVGGAHDPTTPDGRTAMSSELGAILEQIIQAANGYDGERYLYGGQYTKSPPFSIVNGRYVNYLGDDKSIYIQTDTGVTTAINATGKDAFGNMDTVVDSRDMNPDICLSTDHSTRISDLNGGKGVPMGKIMVYYSAYPDGLEVDLSNCDTMEDVKDAIEKQTLEASKKLNTAEHKWLDQSNLNWRDLQDRYVKVTINPEHNGISLQEFDLGEPMPPANEYERLLGLDYTGAPGYPQGGGGTGIGVTGEETTVYDKQDYVYPNGQTYYAPLMVQDVAGNKVAEGLGIKGSAPRYDQNNPDPVLDGFLHGRDLNPALSDRTLLADLEGYNDSVYTFTNGSKPGTVKVEEISPDSQNVFNSWNLNGLSVGNNTGPNGELYAKVTRRGAPDNDLFVELYTKPIDKAKPSDLVATGSYTASSAGGTVQLQEANSSGLSGSVGIVLSTSTTSSTVNLLVDMGEQLQSSVHVPAFIEESNIDGTPKDKFGIASGWNIRGLDKPPANGYDTNHPASTDLDGDVSVNYRYDGASNSFVVELYRPSFGNQPAKLIATGSISMESQPIYMGDDNAGNPIYKYDTNTPHPTTTPISGRVEITGVEGFEGIKGSVYLELPAGLSFSTPANHGADSANPTQITYQLDQDAAAGTMVLGGAMEMVSNHSILGTYRLTDDTLFLAGQKFDNDVYLPDGGMIKAGTVLTKDLLVPKGCIVQTDVLLEGTVLPEGCRVTFGNALAAGTVVPRGTYYDPASANGFPSGTMGMQVTHQDMLTGDMITESVGITGYDVRATFATIEDFNRAVAEAGVHVQSRVASDGKSIEFISTLAGAYMTVSEDTDCYEQMNDKYKQLNDLDLNGLVKSENSDNAGNVYQEVIYYPPNNPYNPNKTTVTLIADDGTTMEIEPGYYVRVYSDKSALDVSYENRDNSSMVAEGFLKAPEWDDPARVGYDPNNPFVIDNPAIPGSPPPYTIGVQKGMILEERNNSGVTGTVDLDYYGDRDQMQVRHEFDEHGVLINSYNDYDPYHNDAITVFPGGLRPEGSRHTKIQEWDLVNIEPGITCDYSGTYHGKIERDTATAAGVKVALHRDASHSTVTARNDPAEPLIAPGNVVQLYETTPDGEFVLVDGKRVPAGTMSVDFTDLPNGVADKFTLTTGATRITGQEREENLFSTFNDIIDALNAGDVETLHDLIGTVKKDLDRLLEARGDVASRTASLKTVKDRQTDDVISFTATLTSRVLMDTDTLAEALLNKLAAENAYNAAMQVASSIMQMSLLDYLR